jgi:hypothetical protein
MIYHMNLTLKLSAPSTIVIAVALIAVHVVHTLLGMPGMETIEQMLIAWANERGGQQ